MKKVLTAEPGYESVDMTLGGVPHVIYSVPGRGDCLYHSMGFLAYAYGVLEEQFTVEKTHAEVRELLVLLAQDIHGDRSIKWRDPAAKKDFFDNYTKEIAEMKRPGGYGSEVAMRASIEAFVGAPRAINFWYRDPATGKWAIERTFRRATDYLEASTLKLPVSIKAPDLSKIELHIAHVVAGYPDPSMRTLNHFCPMLPTDHAFDDEPEDPAERDANSFKQSLDLGDAEELQPLPKRETRIRLGAARSHAASPGQNTYDTLLRLPMIDVHCHLGGKSISGGMPWVIDKVAYSKARIGFYGLQAEAAIARKVINRMQRFCSKHRLSPAVAGTAMMLDFSYCALAVPTAAIDAVKGIRSIWRGFCRMQTAVVTLGGSELYRTWKGEEDPYDGSLVGVGTGTEKEAITRHKEIAGSSVAEDHYYTHPEERSPPKYLWVQRDRRFYERALKQISEAAAAFPGEVWPFVGFDPRRANGGLDIVKECIRAMGFVGVKLYSRTGWMPTKNAIMYGDGPGSGMDRRLEALYRWVTENDVAMLVHTSPTGFPPDEQMVLPWLFHKQQREHKYDGKRLQIGSAATVPWPPGIQCTQAERAKDPEVMIRAHAAAHAQFCLYNQWTTSPYSWEPVLDAHPALRLNMAHFGAEIGTYSTPRRNVPFDEDWNSRLRKYPYVCGSQAYGQSQHGKYGYRDFARSFKNGVFARIEEEVKENKKHFSNIFLDQVRGKLVLDSPDQGWLESDRQYGWADWLGHWKAVYPYSWHEKILRLLASGKYKNLYTDIAYLTARDIPSFDMLFRPMIGEALGKTDDGKTLRERMMIGTDWFMTEMDNWAPDDFWNAAYTSFEKYGDEHAAFGLGFHEKIIQANLKILWRMWSSENALRYLNLGARLKDLNAFYDKSAHPRPDWWKDLERFYQNDWEKPSELIPQDQAEKARQYERAEQDISGGSGQYKKKYTASSERERQEANTKKAKKAEAQRKKEERQRQKQLAEAMPDQKRDQKDMPSIPPVFK
jgi:predicted TIM-barrel fold metal-dependent hydrolase